MLKDQDRIFRNIYGLEDVGLTGARARGVWDGTKALVDLGRETIIENDQGIRPARSWWCGLLDGHEMVVYAERRRRASALFGHQRGRE